MNNAAFRTLATITATVVDRLEVRQYSPYTFVLSLSLKGLILLEGTVIAPAGRLLSLAGPGKVSSWAGWGALPVVVVSPPVAALCVGGLLAVRLLLQVTVLPHHSPQTWRQYLL